MIPATTIRFSDFVIISPRPLEWADVEGVLYATDGLKAWELKEIPMEEGPTGAKGTA